MLISIVIPVYKVEEYIERCLQSVIAQDYEGDLECLLIDDCTPDNSCAVIDDILDRYEGPIKFRLLHHEKNRGLSAARNTGIDNALGDYIYFLDSDDYISSDCISKLAAPLTEGDCDIVIGKYTILGSNIKFPTLKLGNKKLTCNDDILGAYVRDEWYMMAWNKLCNLSFIKSHSLYFKEGLIHEDDLWSFQYACWAQSLISVDVSTYYYCAREDSIMGASAKMSSIKNHSLVLKYMINFLDSNHLIHPLYCGHLRNKYQIVRNFLVKSVSDGIRLDQDFLDTFRFVSTRLDADKGVKDKFVNFLILNSHNSWAAFLLTRIHKVLAR